MQNVRRWYIYLTSAISLNVVAWALIALLRNLLDASSLRSDTSFLALQIAIIVIGLPVFLVHWLWAQRLAAEDKEEKSALLRRIYFYGILAGFLGPILANAYSFFLGVLDGELARDLLGFMVAVVILALLFAYHRRLLDAEILVVPETGLHALVRRAFVYAFSAGGLWMLTSASLTLLRLLFGGLDSRAIFGRSDPVNSSAVSLLLGLLVWVFFWRWAESLFGSEVEAERASVLRKFYLYLVVFITTIGVVGAGWGVLGSLFRRWLSLPPQGESGRALSLIIAMGVVWAYHSVVLRRDAAAAPDAPRQAGVRRLYLYLVAGVGLGAFLIGLAGDVNVLISALTQASRFGTVLKESLADFSAAMIAGLPVWLLPWRAAQLAAEPADALDHRRSLARKIYLYFYLFAATMTILSTLIAIVYQILLLILGERSSTALLPDLAEPLAYALIALAVLLYHGSILREDGRRERAAHVKLLEEFKVVVVGGDDGQLGRALVDALRAEFPALDLTPLGLTSDAADAMNGKHTPDEASALLADANLLIGPWDSLAGDRAVVAASVAASPARRLLLPTRPRGMDWVAVEPPHTDELVEGTVKALRQILAGDEVRPGRPLGAGAVIAIIIGGIFALMLLANLLSLLFNNF